MAADGGWLLPFWQTACKAAGGSGTNAAGVLRSTDQGKTWAVSHPIHGDEGNSTKVKSIVLFWTALEYLPRSFLCKAILCWLPAGLVKQFWCALLLGS